MLQEIQSLMKALEAGQYNQAPGTLTQGSALQTEDLSPIMHDVVISEKQLKLQKMISSKDAKGTLIQFNRQLSYGILGGSAQYEGAVGEEDTSDFAREVVPMAYYSTVRRVTVQANMISAFDGVKAEDRSADDAAKKLAYDIEFDLFKGYADFSNAGQFDGNPGAFARLPNMVGIDAQIRQSDALSNTQDLMFAEYGTAETIVLPVNGSLNQSVIEDAAVRNVMNEGNADVLLVDPISASHYNKIAFNKERIMLAGSAQDATGAELRKQWTSSGTIAIEASRFLSGKTRPSRQRAGAPLAPASATPVASGSGSQLTNGTYIYRVSAANERGESMWTAGSSVAVTAGQLVTLTIAFTAGAKYFNVYRTKAGAAAGSAKFIGKVKASEAGATSFIDLGNRLPGSVTGYLIQKDTMGIHQLSPYQRLKQAVVSLSLPEAHFRFLCVAVYVPRKDVLLENIEGQL